MNDIQASYNLTDTPDEFIAYPTNRLVAFFDRALDCRRTLKKLASIGFAEDAVFVLHGPEGAEAFDAEGANHGVMGMVSRAFHKAVSDGERKQYAKLDEHLREGGIAIAVEAPEPVERGRAIQIMEDNGGRELVFFARFYIEQVE